MNLPPADQSIAALRNAYAQGRLTPVAAVSSAYARMDAADDNPIWIHRLPREAVLERAAELERVPPGRRAGLPLYGIPFAIKDNIDAAGLPTTAGCPQFAHTPTRSASVVDKLLEAGAILLGKTNLDQFATGLVGARSPYGACRNAFDPRYISGGSSSGSALAVARGYASFALGTDTAGSGRVPAAFNNLVGLKPTRGLVSTLGVVPACRSLDCVSVFAHTCADACAVLSVIEGYDAADPFSRRAQSVAGFSSAGLRVALPRADQLEFFGDEGYAKLFAAAAARFEQGGAKLLEIDLTPFLAAQALLYDGPWVAERLAPLERFLAEQPEAFHPVTRQVIESARRFSAADTFRAIERLAELRRSTEAVWDAADLLLVPGAPTLPTLAALEAEPVAMNSRLGLYTNFVNLLDLAAITVPAGFREDGLPFGVTLVGPAFSDRCLANAGSLFTGQGPLPAQPPSTVRVAVVGAHLSGMPLNHELISRRARLLRATRTSPDYRLYALEDASPPKPALLKVGSGHGSCIDVEVWEMPITEFGSFVAAIPAPLGIGSLTLEDGETLKGFLCEQYAVAGRRDITSLGGWRKFAAAPPAPATPATPV